jgi:hypothetical protein
MCMVTVGIDPELSDELYDQTELSRALVDFNEKLLDTLIDQPYTY